jgi:predicted CopG family antitoxin
MTKVISLSNRAYETLSALKRRGESFSDVVLRLSKREKSILRHAGKWEGDDALDIFSDIARKRKEVRSREVKF